MAADVPFFDTRQLLEQDETEPAPPDATTAPSALSEPHPAENHLAALQAEVELLRQWLRDYEQIAEAAYAYRQAQKNHRRDRGLETARAVVRTEIALDKALANLK
jgi:hypothetical protein